MSLLSSAVQNHWENSKVCYVREYWNTKYESDDIEISWILASLQCHSDYDQRSKKYSLKIDDQIINSEISSFTFPDCYKLLIDLTKINRINQIQKLEKILTDITPKSIEKLVICSNYFKNDHLDRISDGLWVTMPRVSNYMEFYGLYLDNHLLQNLLECSAHWNSVWINDCIIRIDNDFYLDENIDFKINKLYVKLNAVENYENWFKSIWYLVHAMKKTKMTNTLKNFKVVPPFRMSDDPNYSPSMQELNNILNDCFPETVWNVILKL